jgi:hypothetical protein
MRPTRYGLFAGMNRQLFDAVLEYLTRHASVPSASE